MKDKKGSEENKADGTQEVEQRVICPFCAKEMDDIYDNKEEYKCLNLQCPLADYQSIYDFTFLRHEIPNKEGI